MTTEGKEKKGVRVLFIFVLRDCWYMPDDDRGKGEGRKEGEGSSVATGDEGKASSKCESDEREENQQTEKSDREEGPAGD